MEVAIKSTFWVVTFGGIGYALFKLSKPDDATILKYKEESKHTEASKNAQKCIDVLKEAASNKDGELNKRIETLIKK